MDPNRNDSHNNPKKPGDGQKPKSNIWLSLIIAVLAMLLIGSIYNMINKSQYQETTWSDFRQAFESNNLAEVELRYDRIIYLTKDEAAKHASEQKACYTGLPNGNIMELADQMVAMGVKVNEPIVEDNSGIMLILYYVGMGLLIFGMMNMVTKRMGGGDGMMGGVGKSKAKVYME